MIVPPSSPLSRYPERGPEIRLYTTVYHPLVNPTNGILDLRHQFPQWKAHKDHICHVLHYLKNAFTETMLSHLQHDLCANREAYAVCGAFPLLCLNCQVLSLTFVFVLVSQLGKATRPICGDD